MLNSKHVCASLYSIMYKHMADTFVLQFIGLHGYLLVYSVSSPQSFDMITIIRDKILNHLVLQDPSRRCDQVS